MGVRRNRLNKMKRLADMCVLYVQSRDFTAGERRSES